MVKELTVEGFDELEKVVKTVEESKTLTYVLFCGSLGPDGKSWCPDCVTAEEPVNAGKVHLPPDAVLITCHVGAREYWKDMNNPFRVKMGIKCVPTLLKWGEAKRLEESECAIPDLIQMLFTDNE